MRKSTRTGSNRKPAKPYPEFPLFPHATGRWAKKIRGKFHYFGRWDDPDGALKRYLSQRDDLHAGRKPRDQDGGTTVRHLLNRFLTTKTHLLRAGELTNRTFEGYKLTCEWIADVFGLNRVVDDLGSDDFEKLRSDFAKKYGPVGVGNEINKTRIVFKYAFDAGLVDKPIRFGPGFKRPSRKVLRLHRQSKPLRMFEREELDLLLNAAVTPLKAMIYLGINCGFGNADVGTLPIEALDLENGWHHYHRPKTGVARRCPLWPETVRELCESLASRPTPKTESAKAMVFLTQRGHPWHKDSSDNPVSKEAAKLLKRLGIKRPGLNFYALRHTFETVAGQCGDQVAVSDIMGHAPAPNDMSSVYRERIDDERLLAVVEHIRQWLNASQNR